MTYQQLRDLMELLNHRKIAFRVKRGAITKWDYRVNLIGANNREIEEICAILGWSASYTAEHGWRLEPPVIRGL